ncbi:MAG: tandem-95 repeat protein, partial [bacterium]|nr:tandem-95 repeat protein [bacterium]
DDDGGTGCGDVPVTVRNLPPVVEAGEKVLLAAGEPVALEPSTFVDAGVLDTHTATIDWGDGTVEAGVVSETSGSGTVAGSHTYAVEENFVVEVCVTDKDGDTGCDSFQINAVLDPGLTKESGEGSEVIEPGEVLEYTVTVFNNGTVAATGVEVVDPLPEYTSFVTASDGGVYDPLTDTVTWTLGSLEPGETRVLTLTLQADFVLPVGAVIENSVTVVDDDDSDTKPGDEDDDSDGDTSSTPPDLTILTLDRVGSVVDRQELTLSGTVGVEITNQGGADIAETFQVTVFEDTDLDRGYTESIDQILGTAEVTGPFALGATLTVPVTVAGAVRFPEDLIWAFVDSRDDVAEVDESNNLLSTGADCRLQTVLPSRTYTTDADFDEGVLFNVNHDPPHHDELRLNRITEPFPFLWVAVSSRGTAVKIDTVTGQILGEYRTAPSGRGTNPSRTTVDLNGNAWVGNRNESSGNRGSAVHIGLAEAFQCVDRNGNGVIDTSTGLGDIKPWPNTGGVDNTGGVSTAEDECIIHYVRTNGTGVRTVAVNRDNDVWIGGLSNHVHDLVDGDTGVILDTIRPACGGYGGFVHPDGTLWSANTLLRYDPVADVATCVDVKNSYGLGVDGEGDVWNSQWTRGTVTQMAPDGTIRDVFQTGGDRSRGVAVTGDDNVWIANSGSASVTRLSNDGDLLATIGVGNTPTGVAVDAAGKVWVTNLGSNNVMRIDPATNSVDLTVSLGSGAGPYNYSDMTGAVALGRTAPQGRWTVIYDSGQTATAWGRVKWSAYVPPGAGLSARARSAEAAGDIAADAWVDVERGLEMDLPAGRFLQVEINFLPSPAGDTPIVYDVTVEPRSGLPDLSADFIDVVHRLDEIEFTARIGNSGDAPAPAGTPVSLYDADPAAGGTLIATFTNLLRLAPGQFQDVRFVWASPPAGTHPVHVVANDDGTGSDQGTVEECDRTNNTDVEVVTPEPDLLIPAMDRSGVVTDLQTLAISGTLAVDLLNQGNLSVTDDFTVTVWEDSDGDGELDAAVDNVLGQAVHSGTVAADQTVTLQVAIAGAVLFRDNVIHAFVDSAEVIAERDEDNNLNSTGALCEVLAPAGQFAPTVEWHWNTSSILSSSIQVMSTPVVIDLTGDGVPEVVFATFTSNAWTANAHLRAVDGRDGSEVFTVSDPALDITGGAEIAVGDIDLDGRPEIVTLAESKNRLIAFEHDGSFKWRSHSVRGTAGGGGVAIADLDRDGVPEIVFGADVLNADGTRRWSASGSRGDNHGTVGGLPVVVDLDLSGDLEVVAGNTARRSDGSVYWTASGLTDGFNAIGNFDADDFPEVVLVDNGSVYVLEHDGSIKWGPVSLPGGGRGGAPTVADVDGDGEAEIGVAGSTSYVIFETDGSVKWQVTTQDGSSHVTGSSVFDFEGDGSAEVVYADELFLRIYSGADGTELYRLARGSGTVYEMPVVADVDADGNAEIVVVANDTFGFGNEQGILVVGDTEDSWVPTRRIWNQHTYHIDNVGDDGQVPRLEEPSWLSHNSYRLNRLSTSVLAAPDLTASVLAVDLANPGVEIPITVRIGNGGAIFAPAGVPVAFYDSDPAAGGTLVGTAATSRVLEPEQFEDVTFVWSSAPAPGDYTVFVTADDDGAGGATVRECDEANNQHFLSFTVPTVPDLSLMKDDGRDGVVPGLELTYTLTVTNVGTRDATGVTLSDTLPAEVTFVSAGDGGAESGGVVTWPAISLASGAGVERTLTVRVSSSLPPSVTEITNTATVADDGSGGPDPTPENNTATDIDGRTNNPVAVDDQATTDEDQPVSIDILANDSDDDSDPLTVTEVTDPANGTAELQADATVLYTPATHFFGTDTFTYTISDGTGGSDTATVTVTVISVNDPPNAVNDLYETDQDVALVLDLLANDSDPENDPLSFLQTPQPFGGTVELSPDGTVTYTPAPGFVGVDNFPYTITDGNGGSDTALVQVVILPVDEEPPVIVIAGVTDGDCVNTDVTPAVSASDDSPFVLTITLNGETFENGTPVTDEGDYTLVATAVDDFGNSATETVTWTIDKTEPAVEITGVPDGQCVNVPVTPEIVASDDHLDLVVTTLNGVPFTSGTTVSAEGDYVLEVTAADECGNSRVETRAWTIDVTPPVIDVAGVADGDIVNVDVTPVIDVTDDHLGPVTITLDGQPFVSGTTITAEGDYTLEITAADQCGNSSPETVTFTIDKTPPAIAITGVADGDCVNTDVVPVITVIDDHLEGSSATLNGQPFTSGSTVTAEGDYTLIATATDTAGNSATETLAFTIDRTLPVIQITGVADGSCVNTDVVPLVDATDDHLGAVTITLDGQPFGSGDTITAEGDYVLAVTADDQCGNSAAESVSFTVDKTPPLIEITGVADGAIVNTDVVPQISVTELHPGSTTITLNGAPFTSGTVLTEEGDYTLEVASSDACGNSSSETVSFTLDKTPPEVTITGFVDGECVNTDVVPVIAVTDAHLDTVATTLDGAPFISGTTVAAEGDHTLVVTASDLAGNTTDVTQTFTIDKTDPAIAISGVPDGQCVNVDVTPVIDVTDTHLGPVTITLNGLEFTSGTTVANEGDYTLEVSAADDCGNASSETRTWTIDKTPPAITITGISDGANVNTDVTPVIDVTDLHLGPVTITLDGQPFTS